MIKRRATMPQNKSKKESEDMRSIAKKIVCISALCLLVSMIATGSVFAAFVYPDNTLDIGTISGALSKTLGQTFSYDGWDWCVAKGTKVTLSSGEKVNIEDLSGNENLLVWNLMTGTFDSAPIMFVEEEKQGVYEIIKLSFSDGTTVDVIYEHAFWDFDLNEYVFIGENADNYIGHYFNKQTLSADGQMTWEKVMLTDVEVYSDDTVPYSLVTQNHFCFYVNDLLSIPGGISSIVNIFDVDANTLMYDKTKMAQDIQTYGLYTYEEFNAMLPLPKTMFDGCNVQYMKVAQAKGKISTEEMSMLVERYAVHYN